MACALLGLVRGLCAAAASSLVPATSTSHAPLICQVAVVEGGHGPLWTEGKALCVAARNASEMGGTHEKEHEARVRAKRAFVSPAFVSFCIDKLCLLPEITL